MDFDIEKEKTKEALFKQYLEEKHQMVLSSILKNKDVRFYLAELLGFCKTFENAFNEKGNVAAYQNGMQAVGQKIFSDIMECDAKIYVQMCEEEKEILALRETFGGK